MSTLVRRCVMTAMVAGASYTAWAAWQRRSAAVGTVGTPVWPPFERHDSSPPPPSAPEAAPPVAFAALDDVPAGHDSADASHTSTQRWVPPVEGRCPDGFPIKANDNSKIFHVPGGRFYDRTVPERCYADAADAEADGYRRAKA